MSVLCTAFINHFFLKLQSCCHGFFLANAQLSKDEVLGSSVTGTIVSLDWVV